MRASHLQVDHVGKVVIIRLDRPPANAVDLSLMEEFERVLGSVLDKAPDAIVLTGSGSFFSGGLDLKVVPFYSTEEQNRLITRINALVGRLYGCPVPLVGAINGHAIAGGMIMALTCDYRVGPDGDYKFGLTEARVGIPFPAAPMVVLQAELSRATVRVAGLLATHVSPKQALASGILDELQPPARLLARAIDLAREMGEMPRGAYWTIKQQIRAVALKQIDALVTQGSDPLLSKWISPEASNASRKLLRKQEG